MNKRAAWRRYSRHHNGVFAPMVNDHAVEPRTKAIAEYNAPNPIEEALRKHDAPGTDPSQ